jgi:hypothetical protein
MSLRNPFVVVGRSKGTEETNLAKVIQVWRENRVSNDYKGMYTKIPVKRTGYVFYCLCMADISTM